VDQSGLGGQVAGRGSRGGPPKSNARNNRVESGIFFNFS
jgi:hypothetical protein